MIGGSTYRTKTISNAFAAAIPKPISKPKKSGRKGSFRRTVRRMITTITKKEIATITIVETAGPKTQPDMKKAAQNTTHQAQDGTLFKNPIGPLHFIPQPRSAILSANKS